MLLYALSITVVIVSHVEPTAGQKKCRDCTPYIYCTKARILADAQVDKATEQLFADAYCGLHNEAIAKVCCSDFNTRQQNKRSIIEPEHPNAKLLPKSCGTIPSIRFGENLVAGIYEFPWMVLIAGDNNKFECAGTLINSRYVLTAAHCVVNKDIRGVRIGDFDLQHETDCEGNICDKFIQDREMEKYIVRDDYEPVTFTNDIALLRLSSPVVMPLRNADAICLPTTKEMQEGSIAYKQGTVAGWGLTEYNNQAPELRKLEILVQPNNVCEQYYSHISGSEPKQFCVGVHGKNSCQGDFGGPLMIKTMVNKKSRFVQYGILSNGLRQCGSDSPRIYTDVRKYMDWILDNIEE